MSYIELDEKLIKELERITMGDYRKKGTMISSDMVECIIEDLICEVNVLKEQIEDLRNINDNSDEEYEMYRDYQLGCVE